MRFRGRRGASGLVVAAAALLAGGCSSSSHHSTSSSPTTVQSSSSQTSSSQTTSSPASVAGSAQSASCSSVKGVRGVTGSEINVEGLVTVLDFGPSASTAAKARFNQANADGELPCGRKINYLGFADDGGTPDQNLADVRRFVQLDHVFAISPVLSPFLESGSGSYINQQHVPTVGWGVSSSFCTKTNLSDMYLFGFNGCIVPAVPTYETAINGPVAAKLFPGGATGKTVAVIGDDSSTSMSGVTTISAQFVDVGMDLVYHQNPMPGPPAQVTDFSPYVQALLTADGGHPPDALFISSGPTIAFPLSRALREGGYKGIIIHTTYDPSVAAASATDDVILNTASVESTAPQMASIASTLRAAGVTDIGEPALYGYLSADYLVQLLKATGPDLTQQRFQQVASSFTYRIPNVVGPTYYPAGFQAGAPCGEMVYSNGTKWTVSVPYSCASYDLKQENGKYVQVPYPSGIK
jgi:Periplasmic binding protein